MRVVKTEIISSFDKTPGPVTSVLPTLELNFILPTADKSYLSSDWNKLVNSCVAASFVGGSPGRIILYISIKAVS